MAQAVHRRASRPVAQLLMMEALTVLGLDNTNDNKLPNKEIETYYESNLSLTPTRSGVTGFPNTQSDLHGPEIEYRDFNERIIKRIFHDPQVLAKHFERLNRLPWGGE